MLFSTENKRFALYQQRGGEGAMTRQQPDRLMQLPVASNALPDGVHDRSRLQEAALATEVSASYDSLNRVLFSDKSEGSLLLWRAAGSLGTDPAHLAEAMQRGKIVVYTFRSTSDVEPT